MSELLWIFAWIVIGYLIGILHTMTLQFRSILILNSSIDLIDEKSKLISNQQDLIIRLLKT